MSSAAPQRFVVLDSFRGLCAVSVVLFHLHLWQSMGEWRFFRSAGLLVAFFFVLSGFVLAHRYHQQVMNGAGWRDFMISRSCRILPLHLATLLLISVLMLLRPLLFDVPLAQLPGLFWHDDLQQQWLYNALLLQAWWPKASLFSFNGPAWSISVEYYIYVVFGLIVLLARRRSIWAYASMVLLGSLATAWLAPKIAHSPGLRGLICFFLGAAAYSLHLRWRNLSLGKHWMTALEGATLLALYWMITLKYPHKAYWASWGFTAAILVFASERGQISAWLKQKAFLQLGEWSFSIYLIHFVLLYLLSTLLMHFQPEWFWQVGKVRYIHTGSVLGNNLLLLAILALVLGCARASYRWIERPGMRLGKRWQQYHASPKLTLASVRG
ncbi:acyltransferase [Chitinibacter sp. GC72]|uniref:acyltransferase family protein n=1 Tax=Chitinibacter sp. GC72 TaxID=1526917 RepID=UPI0012F78B8E|nr:acyltransferase [Chitinibacter sp. GC72]